MYFKILCLHEEIQEEDNNNLTNYIYAYIRVIARFIAIGCYVEIVIPVEKRLEFNIYQAHRGEDFASGRLLHKFSNTP